MRPHIEACIARRDHWLRDGHRRNSQKQQALHAPPLGTTQTQATHRPRRGCEGVRPSNLPLQPGVHASRAHAVCVCKHPAGCHAHVGRLVVEQGMVVGPRNPRTARGVRVVLPRRAWRACAASARVGKSGGRLSGRSGVTPKSLISTWRSFHMHGPKVPVFVKPPTPAAALDLWSVGYPLGRHSTRPYTT